MERTRLAKASLAELKKNIRVAKERKEKLKEYLNHLHQAHSQGKILSSEYLEVLHKKHDKRSIHEHIHYYDNFIKEQENKIRKHSHSSRSFGFFILVLILSLSLLAYFYLEPTITGFFTQAKAQEKEFTQNVNLNFDKSTTYELRLENPGQLGYVKLDGLIKGQGSVKVYLDNILILDSSNIKQKTNPSLITGASISNSEEVNETPQNISNETSSFLDQDGNLETPGQKSGTEKSPTSEILNETNETTDLKNTSQNEIKETTTPEEKANEEEIIGQEVLKEFSNICEETCDLASLNLNKTSYTLKIEIENAELFLNTIKYSIIAKSTEKNITGQNLTISEENITTIQGEAILGQPVKWKKTFSVANPGKIKIKLPKEATNILTKEKEAPQNTLSPFHEEFPSQKEISFDAEAKDYEINYETPAPLAEEEKIERGKRVKISSPENIHYTNVLASTDLDENLNIKNPARVKILWVEQNTFIVPEKVEDLDANGIYDYIEWTVPSLSNQTFDIIVITKAEHLDSNRKFISDIYEQVKELDNNWSEEIPNQNYVRVTFEVPLDNTRDITIYPRVVSGNPKVEVYEVNQSNLIATFENLKSNEYNKVFLTNLGQGQCYDNETEVFTDKGWKLFSKLTKEEKVMTLNKETGKKEWQVPSDYQTFNHDEEMYKIKTEKGDLVVSPKHKVYVNQISLFNNLSINSFVVNTSANDCSLRCGSLDQIDALIDNAKARYGESSGSINEALASSRNFSYLVSSTNLMNPSTSVLFISNSCSDSFDLDKQISLYFSNSDLINSGAKNSTLINENKYEATDFGFMSEKNMLLSNTSLIFYLANLSLMPGETSPNNFLNLPFLAFLPRLTDHSVNSFSSLDFNLSFSANNVESLINCSTTLAKATSNSFLNSAGTSTLTTISAINKENLNLYLNLSDFSLQPITQVYEKINQGKEIYFLDKDNAPVKIISIEKIPYNGKIYGVDVENDIVSVRHGGENSTAFWSGNSEGYSQDTFDLKVIGGSVEFDYIVDPPIPQFTGGLLVYADTVDVGLPKYQTFNGSFGAEQNATSVGSVAIEWIRVAASPTKDEWIIATKDAVNDIKVQVCNGTNTGVSCGSITTITTEGVASFRNYDVAYEMLTGDALLVYGNSTANVLRKIEWTDGSWQNDAVISLPNTTGTVEWVELTSRNNSNQIGIAYSDTNDDIAGMRWGGTSLDSISGLITASGVTRDVRKFDVSFEGTSGDMLVAGPLAATGTLTFGTLVGTAWTISTAAGVDVVTDFIDLQEPNPIDNDIAMTSHGTTTSTTLSEGYEWDGTAIVDGTAGDDNVANWAANEMRNTVAFLNETYYAVAAFANSTGTDDIDWWTMGSAGTITDQTPNLRTRGATRFVDMFDYPNESKVLLITADANSDLWADTWDGALLSATAWTDLTSGGARETSLASPTFKAWDFAFRTSAVNPPKWNNNLTNGTEAGTFILHSVNWTDDTALSGYIFSFDNGTGSFVNNSFASFSGIQNFSNVTKYVNQTIGSTIRWIVYANDSSGDWNVTSTFQYTTTGDVPPKYQNPSTNNTNPLPGATVSHNINWTDDVALSYSILEVNSSGASCNTASNVTNTTLSGTQQWSNLSWQIPNACEGKTIGWKQYANDSSNKWNLTILQTYNIQNVAPTVTLPIYTNGTQKQNTESLTFNISVSDVGIGASYCAINVNANANQTVAVSNGWCNGTYALTGIADGNKTISAYANDTLGNLALNNSYVVFIDSTAPTITLPVYTNATQKQNTDTLTLNISVSDSGSGTTGTVCLVDVTGTNQSIAYSNGWCNSSSISLTGLSDGNKTIKVYANDSLNNLGLNNSYVVEIISQVAPTVSAVETISAKNPTDDTTTSITFNFTATDANGASNINRSEAKAYFQRAGESTRSNTSCINTSIGVGNNINFTCTINMWYFDQNGAWTINATIKDNSASYAENSSTTFVYNLLPGMKISPTSLTWLEILIGQTNTGSNNDPIQINNTGNDIDVNINITSYNLRGEITTSDYIYANNFTIENESQGCSGTQMSNATSTNITSAILQRGNHSLNYNNATSGQEQIYFCLKGLPTGISQQPYSSAAYGSWEIKILLALIIPRLRKKKKSIKDDKLVKALDIILDELKEEYSLNKKEIAEVIMSKLKEKYNLSKKEILNTINPSKETEIPATIFSKELGALEALVKYMKENLNMNYKKISGLLDRNERTIWTAYSKTKEKQKEALKIKETEIHMPLEIFKDKKLTILESAIVYLKEKGLKFSEISSVLERDQRNIWTTYTRTLKKLNKKDNNI